MANSFVRYTGNNSTTSYAIPFSYRATGDLTVTLAGVATTAYTLNAAGTTLTFNSAPAQDVAIEIRRKTSQTTRLTDYADGSVLTENDLDTDSTQAFYMGQEAIDDANDVIKPSNTNFQWDANNKRIINVANPTSNQDVATKHYLENTWLSASDKTAITTVNSNIANINTVNSNITNINSAVSNATNINTVATNISSVNTVAADITKVIAVANDLAEAVSEIETVADDLNETSSEIEVVGANITNVNTVGGISANVTTVAGVSANVTTVAGISANVTTVAGISGDVTAVANISSDVAAVENIKTNVTTVAGIASDVTAVANISSDVAAVENIAANVTTVAGNNANITTVAGANSNITTVAGAITNVNNVGGAITNVNNVGGSIANVNTVATNLSGVNSFAERYRVSSSAPTSSNDIGDLYFDSTANELKVYKSSGWAAAGSTVNGTSARFNYTATANQTTFTGADTAGNTLAYDAGYADVYLNGVRLSGADITITSGTSVVLATGAAVGDILDVVAYGTFNVASVNAGNIDAGTLNSARLPTVPVSKGGTNLTALGTAGQVIKVNSGANALEYVNGSITINGSAVSLGGSVTVGETKPTATGCTPSTITNSATNVVIAGTNFTSIPQVWAINTATGIWYLANSVTYTSATSITANFTLTVDAQYKIRVENPDGNATLSTNNILTVSDEPTWSTSSGSLGSVAGNFSGTVATLSASSDSAITYSETTNVLTNASQANCALNSSTGAITTSDFGGSSTTATTYNFTIRATDAESQTTDRTFSLTSSFGATGGGQFN
ncbi:tail fiber [Pelagibacter phage HTVC105P]|nr:tail fiber [Pelagibacter phage HTVC105P]